MVTPSSSRDEVHAYLFSTNLLKEETISLLYDEEVDGAAFFELTENVLRENFKNFTFGERSKLLRILNNLKAQLGNNDSLSSSNASDYCVIDFSSSTSADSNVSLAEELGCQTLFTLDESGILQPAVSPEGQACMSNSFQTFLKKRKPSCDSIIKSKKIEPKTDLMDVEPMDVLQALNASEIGKKAVAFIMENKYMSTSVQITVMDIIYSHMAKKEKSPEKYYPDSSVKVSMAKGIVRAFPFLADTVGDCPWASWLRIVQTKYETVRSNLPQEKKKNLMSKSSSGSPSPKKTPAVKKTPVKRRKEFCPSSSSTPAAEDPDYEAQKSWLKDVVPTSRNKKEISDALAATFVGRRNWIVSTKPTCTDVINQFKPLACYEGEMIAEEFYRMEKMYVDVESRFQMVSSQIVQHAARLKIDLPEDSMFNYDDCLKAILLLPKVLTPTINAKTTSVALNNHVKLYKKSINSIPSSALLQIAPENSDVEQYESVESSKDNPSPVFPYVLWCTNNAKSGKLYLKIDKFSFLVGSVRQPQESSVQLLKAVSLSMKAHHVFNLEYHPCLLPFYSYLEVLSGINISPPLNVSKLITSLRNL